MKARMAAAVLALLLASGNLMAHRLDKYLQDTTGALERDQVRVEIRLAPGAEVISKIAAMIDRNGDGFISVGERLVYGKRVLGDLTFSVDGEPLTARLISSRASTLAQMRERLG